MIETINSMLQSMTPGDLKVVAFGIAAMFVVSIARQLVRKY